MVASNSSSRTLKGALVGSFFLHALVLMLLSFNGSLHSLKKGAPQEPLIARLVPSSPEVSITPEVVENKDIPDPLSAPSITPESSTSSTQSQVVTKPGILERQYVPAPAKVLELPELALPEDAKFMGAILVAEVDLDENGKALRINVVQESPRMYFTEWLHAKLLNGKYEPLITKDGPKPSKIKIQIDVNASGALTTAIK